MLPFATRRLRGARVLARVRWRSGEGPPLPPQQGTVGGPDYAPSRPRDNQGRALHPRVGAAAAVPPSIPMWGSTPSTAPSQVSVRTSSVPPPPPPAPLAADDTAPRAQLSAAAFSPERLRELGVGGLDEQLASLFRRAFASRAGTPGLARQLGVSHVKGILLHGPPGTGKTLVARKLGQLLAGGREPRVVNGPELLSRWVGASEENVRALFSDAEADWKRNGDDASLHVIIFDEIDALCRARGGGGGGGGGGAQAVGDSVVNQLLTKMDGVASAPNLLLIGLTNRRDLLDEALLRPGRLEVQLEIGLPDRAGRAAILGIHTRAMAASGLLAADVDLDALAAETPNYSGAELAGVVRAAASFAVERIMRPHTHLGDVRTHGAAEGARGLGLGTVSVRASDFSAALTEVAPLLGRAPGSGTARGGLSRTHAPGGVLPTGARLAGVQASLATLARAAADGEPVHALLMGPPGAGKSALAAAAADSLGFPFARCVSASPEAAAGGAGSGGDAGGCPLAAQLLRSFRDAAASSSSVLLLDDVERLIGYSPVGPAYSNAALQTLLALLRAPRGGRVSKGHTLVLATSSDAAAMGALGIAAAFGATVRVPALDAAEAAAALAAAGALGKEDAAAAALQLEAGRDGAGLPVKHLLALVALARRRVGKPAGLLTRAELLETAAQFSIDPRERT